MLTALNLVSAVINVWLAILILMRDSESDRNRSYALFVLAVGYWAVTNMVFQATGDPMEALTWYKLSGPGWVFLPFLFFSFVTAYIRAKGFLGSWRFRGAFIGLCSLLAAALWVDGLMVQGVDIHDGAFSHIPGVLYKWVYIPVLVAAFVAGLVLLLRYRARGANDIERRQIPFLVVAIVVPFVIGTVTNAILPSLDIHHVEIAIPVTTFNAILIGVAMLKYRLLEVTPESASRVIIDTMGDMLIVVDGDMQVLFMNKAAQDALGMSALKAKGIPLKEVLRVPSDDFVDRIEEGDHFSLDGILQSSNGSGSIDVSVSFAPITEQDRRVGVICVAKDIREMRELIQKLEDAKEEMEQLAVTDGLTNVYNRRYLHTRLDMELALAKESETPLAIAMIDLDHFKDINDHFGHERGDEVLRMVAESFQRHIRAEDTVIRYGGDEFVVIMPDADVEGATVVAERLRRAVQELGVWATKTVKMTASFGVSSFDDAIEDDMEAIDSLLKEADQALYQAKTTGRNCVVAS